MLIVSLWCVYIWSVESVVLDPSLYLSPSPPLTDTSNGITPAELWSQGVDRTARETEGVGEGVPQDLDERPKSKRKPQPMEKAKLFWPTLRASSYSVGTGNIQVPLTFSLSGLYGKYSPGLAGTGMIGSTYGTVSEIGGTAVSALAGSSYGKYRTYAGLRVYGGENGPAWSGWGNGKWGNYGKG